VSKKIPSHLKLVVSDVPEVVLAADEDFAPWQAVSAAFRQATGWSLQYVPDRIGRRTSELVWPAKPESIQKEALGHFRLVIDQEGAHAPAWDAPLAKQLAKPITDLWSEVLSARHSLWQREAELAAGVPVSVRKDESHHLALRLESVLAFGAKAIHCQAAGLYLLDDATSQLKLRAAWGLPRKRLQEPARPLEGSLADLEALLGHAVVLSDKTMFEYWRAPEDFSAAVCVPVSTPSIPLGTLWMFCDESRDFTDEQTGLVEMTAGRIAADLEREMLLADVTSRHSLQRQMAQATRVSKRAAHLGPQVDGWEIAGRTHQHESFCAAYFDWTSRPDGVVLISGGAAEAVGIDGSLAIATMRAAARATSGQSPAHVLTGVNNVVWAGSRGDEPAAMAVVGVSDHSSEIEIAAAGPIHWFRFGATEAEAGVCRAQLLGGSDCLAPDVRSMSLRAGELLVLFGVGKPLSEIDVEKLQICVLSTLSGQMQNPINTLSSALLDEVQRAELNSGVSKQRADFFLLVLRRK
jgi:hypothetical protein